MNSSQHDLAGYFGLNQVNHHVNGNGAFVNSGSNGNNGSGQQGSVVAGNMPVHFHHHIENSSVGPAMNGSAGTNGQGSLSSGGYKGHEHEALAVLGQARMQIDKDLDLAAPLSDKSQLLAWNGPAVTITIGGVATLEKSGAMLTPAMFQAAVETAFAGGQTLVVGANGAATGGTATILSFARGF